MIFSKVSFLHGTRFRLALIAGSAACLAAAGFTGGATAAPTLTVLYGFKGKPDGLAPNSRLTMDSSGALYGTTYAGGAKNLGAVFKLTPPAAGQTQWSSTILYSFTDGSDGKDPVGGVIFDSSGALYGTSSQGGGAGTVFKLTPPAAGKTQWTYSLLHSFAASNDGKNPWGRLIMIKGELYGTTHSGGGGKSIGTVFKLTPPAVGKTVWTETVLHRFDHAGDGTFPSSASLIANSSGALYGTTETGGSLGFGMAFKLTPPGAGQTAWTETVLYSFKNVMDGSRPLTDLSLDNSKGVLYGTTSTGGGSSATGCGTVFKLTPPAADSTQWTETVLYRFKGKSTDGCYPHAGVVLESTGALYGTTSQGMNGGNGTVFKLSPPAGGLTQWTETVLYNFKNLADGYDPEAGLILNNGTLYGTTYQGSSVGGVVFKLR